MSNAHEDWLRDKQEDIKLLIGKTIENIEFDKECGLIYFTDGPALRIYDTGISSFDYIRKDDLARLKESGEI